MPNVRNLVVIITLAAAPVPALAVEGFFGRSIPGVWVMPRCGVIGPHPGFSLTLLPVGYFGSTSGTQDEMMLLNRFTVRGMRHALGMEQESGIETLIRNGVIVEKAGQYEFAPEIQRALVREELGDSLRVAEAITRLRLGNHAPDLETPDMQKGAYRG